MVSITYKVSVTNYMNIHFTVGMQLTNGEYFVFSFLVVPENFEPCVFDSNDEIVCMVCMIVCST
jgi:hypothetical protein